MKDNEVKIFSVIVDAEGNDKWIADGVFVDKPKLKAETALVIPRRYCLDQIEDMIGLNKENTVIRYFDTKVLSHGQQTMMVDYFEGEVRRRKSILVTEG